MKDQAHVPDYVPPPPNATAPARGRGGKIADRIISDEVRYHRHADAAPVEARLVEVKHRYAGNAKQALRNIPYDRRLARWRLPELERLYRSRYGNTLPADDAGRGNLLIALNHIAYRSGDVLGKMLAWAQVWASWMPEAEARRIAIGIGIAKHPIRWKADLGASP